jgi:hypothetical protein
MKPDDKKVKSEEKDKPLSINPIKRDKDSGREDNTKEENRITEKEKPAKIQEPDRTAEKVTNNDERVTNDEPDLDTTEGEMTPEEHEDIKKKIPTTHPGNQDL